MLTPHHRSTVAASSVNTESNLIRSISSSTPSTVYIQNPPSRTELAKQAQSLMPIGRTVPVAENLNTPIQAQVLRLPVPQKSVEMINTADVKPRKSPIRIHPQPVRRCATPTPSSDFVHFFPCFPVGSGGSPPLMSSRKFDFVGDKFKVENKEPVTNSFEHIPTSMETFSTAPLLNTHTTGHVDPLHHKTRTLSSDPVIDYSIKTSVSSSKVITSSALDVGASTPKTLQTSSPITTNEASSSPSKTVIVTSFRGYEVKVKYLNTSVTSAPSIKGYQVPMKKRPVNVESFTSHPVDAMKPRSPASQSSSTSELQMTSLYVGASASILDSPSNAAFTSTSDHESDRESPFLEHKKAKLQHHWRKHILNEQTAKEAAELKQKTMEKNRKRTFQVHQYEAPDSKASQVNATKAQNEAKRKATFNLWDRKHHASKITALK